MTGARAGVVAGLFAGGIGTLPPEGHRTGIFKRPLAGPVRLGAEGLEGDVQADRRVHGGPEKALHHYAAESYAVLAEVFPRLRADLVPGSLGENLTTCGWTEDTVCVGDVFALGACRVQVSQPRSPCWKINHKFDEPGLSQAVAQRGVTGWYYRVLEGGLLAAGDRFELLERAPAAVSLRRLWQAHLAHRPDPAELDLLRRAAGLAQGWVRKLSERLDWLRAHGERR
jgi:MOSC domain-containing protein YiiM